MATYNPTKTFRLFDTCLGMLTDIKQAIIREANSSEFKLVVGFLNASLLLAIGSYISHSLVIAGKNPDLGMPIMGVFVIGSAWLFRSSYLQSAPPTYKQRRNVLLLFSVSSLLVFSYPYLIRNYNFPLDTQADLYVIGFLVEILILLGVLKILYFLVLRSGNVYTNGSDITSEPEATDEEVTTEKDEPNTETESDDEIEDSE